VAYWNTPGSTPRPPGELTPVLSHVPTEFNAAQATGWTASIEGGALKVERSAALGPVDWSMGTETGLILVHKQDLMPPAGFVKHETTFGISVLVSQLDGLLGVGAGFCKDPTFTAGNWAGRFNTEAAAAIDIDDRSSVIATAAIAAGQASVDGIRWIQSAAVPTLTSRQGGVWLQASFRFASFFNPAGGPIYPALFFTAPNLIGGVIKVSEFRAGSIPTTL